jgi:hypothetical protein
LPGLEFRDQYPGRARQEVTGTGDRSGRIVTVEALAGRHASREVGAGGPLAWHTNHGRYLAGADAGPRGTSLAGALQAGASRS